ncbi:MAG TPA: hypothetical protein VL172_09020, partial [Kofleriaceae bacterium]|nr:hypothetical protein [Kofleriaceae bacterium]
MRGPRFVLAGALLAAAVPAHAQPSRPADDLPPVDGAPDVPDQPPPADRPVEPPPPPPVSANASLYAGLPPLVLEPVDADTLAFGSSFRIVSGSATLSSSGQFSDGTDDEVATYA